MCLKKNLALSFPSAVQRATRISTIIVVVHTVRALYTEVDSCVPRSASTRRRLRFDISPVVFVLFARTTLRFIPAVRSFPGLNILRIGTGEGK